MLHTEAVDDTTLELIELLQGKEYLKGFHLCGGTALSLYYGHRKSFDIDMFSNFTFDASFVIGEIIRDFQFQLSYSASETIRGFIGDVKVDLIAHKYKYLEEPYKAGEMTLLSEKDICAMKLNAIAVSGQRIKDFADIWYLLQKFNVSEMVGFYKAKYDQQNEAIILKSLIYFDEVDISDMPVLISNPGLKWTVIRKEIEKKVLEYIKSK
jgi:hypothetical protein